MNKAELQQLTRARIRDAKALLIARRWAGAYYLAGYAVEGALKVCIIVRLMKTDEFPERRFSEKCWTHNLTQLAGLQTQLDANLVANPDFLNHWRLVKDWNESSRYDRKDQSSIPGAIPGNHGEETRGTPMGQVILVESQIEDGKRLVDQLIQKGFPVAAASWMLTSDDGQWYLYIVSPIVDAKGPLNAYRKLDGIVRQMPQPFWIGPLEVKLIGTGEPMVKAIRELQRRYPGNRPIHYSGNHLNGGSVEGAYVYPLLSTA